MQPFSSSPEAREAAKAEAKAEALERWELHVSDESPSPETYAIAPKGAQVVALISHDFDLRERAPDCDPNVAAQLDKDIDLLRELFEPVDPDDKKKGFKHPMVEDLAKKEAAAKAELKKPLKPAPSDS